MMGSLKKLYRKISHSGSRLKKWGFFIVCFSLIFLLGGADYLSGFEFSFSLFYLAPVTIAAWFINRNSALFIAAVSSMTWYFSNILAGQNYSTPVVGYWNTIVRLGFFVIVSLLLVHLKMSIQHERDLSSRDFLTGITNSRAFNSLVNLELVRAKRYIHPFTLAFIDLDNFKQINDRFGHSTGDEVLKSVAATIRENIRQTDIVARLGGDEFALFLPESDAESAKISVYKVRALLLKSMKDKNWEVTFSIGVITFNNFSYSLDEVIRKADGLMYAVKDHGKNNILFGVE